MTETSCFVRISSFSLCCLSLKVSSLLTFTFKLGKLGYFRSYSPELAIINENLFDIKLKRRHNVTNAFVCVFNLQRDVTYEEAKQFADENGRFPYVIALVLIELTDSVRACHFHLATIVQSSTRLCNNKFTVESCHELSVIIMQLLTQYALSCILIGSLQIYYHQFIVCACT